MSIDLGAVHTESLSQGYSPSFCTLQNMDSHRVGVTYEYTTSESFHPRTFVADVGYSGITFGDSFEFLFHDGVLFNDNFIFIRQYQDPIYYAPINGISFGTEIEGGSLANKIWVYKITDNRAVCFTGSQGAETVSETGTLDNNYITHTLDVDVVRWLKSGLVLAVRSPSLNEIKIALLSLSGNTLIEGNPESFTSDAFPAPTIVPTSNSSFVVIYRSVAGPKYRNINYSGTNLDVGAEQVLVNEPYEISSFKLIDYNKGVYKYYDANLHIFCLDTATISDGLITLDGDPVLTTELSDFVLVDSSNGVLGYALDADNFSMRKFTYQVGFTPAKLIWGYNNTEHSKEITT